MVLRRSNSLNKLKFSLMQGEWTSISECSLVERLHITQVEVKSFLLSYPWGVSWRIVFRLSSSILAAGFAISVSSPSTHPLIHNHAPACCFSRRWNEMDEPENWNLKKRKTAGWIEAKCAPSSLIRNVNIQLNVFTSSLRKHKLALRRRKRFQLNLEPCDLYRRNSLWSRSTTFYSCLHDAHSTLIYKPTVMSESKDESTVYD